MVIKTFADFIENS